jgi:hypothetical protein
MVRGETSRHRESITMHKVWLTALNDESTPNKP